MTDYMKDIESRYYAYLYRTGDANLDTYREYLSTYLPFIQPNTDVLDLGCGAGDFLEIVSQKQCRATGVDNDSGMLKLARERGLTIIDADAIRYISTEALPESYDFIFADNQQTVFVLKYFQAALLRLVREGDVISSVNLNRRRSGF